MKIDKDISADSHESTVVNKEDAQKEDAESKKSVREPWKNFPPVITNGKMSSLRFDAEDVEAPEYDGAKRNGNMQDALRLIRRKLSPQKVSELKELFEREQVDPAKLVLLPVDALEGEGKNKLPLAIAKVLSEEFGGVPIDTEIKQSKKVSRTGKGIDHRLAFMPSFSGKVEDKEYLVIDDTLTVGGTIANLRGYINQNGGRTVGFFVMQSKEQSLLLQPSEKTYNKLYSKHNREKVDDFCRKEFGFDSTCLTRGEAGNIAAAASLDAMAGRISDAREDGRRNGLKIAEVKADVEIERRGVEIGRRDVGIERRDVEIGRRDVEIERRGVEIGRRDVEIERRDVEIGRRDVERIREKRSKAIDSGRDRGAEERVKTASRDVQLAAALRERVASKKTDTKQRCKKR